MEVSGTDISRSVSKNEGDGERRFSNDLAVSIIIKPESAVVANFEVNNSTKEQSNPHAENNSISPRFSENELVSGKGSLNGGHDISVVSRSDSVTLADAEVEEGIKEQVTPPANKFVPPTFPEGGRHAWLVVFGSMLVLGCTLDYISTFG